MLGEHESAVSFARSMGFINLQTNKFKSEFTHWFSQVFNLWLSRDASAASLASFPSSEHPKGEWSVLGKVVSDVGHWKVPLQQARDPCFQGPFVLYVFAKTTLLPRNFNDALSVLFFAQEARSPLFGAGNQWRGALLILRFGGSVRLFNDLVWPALFFLKPKLL